MPDQFIMTNADQLMSKPFNPGNVVIDSNKIFFRDQTFDTLPHQSPFETAPLRYASPPVEWEQSREQGISIFSPTSSFTFSVAQTGAGVATAFPQAALIASQQVVQPVALIAVSLTYAIRNVTNTGPIGLYVLIDNRPVIGLGGNADLLVSVITPQGAAEQTWSDVRSNSFSLDVAPMINTGQSLSLYCSCANQITDLVWGIVTFKYVVI